MMLLERKKERKKMKIELKAIKHCEWQSEETHSYQGRVYVDGKPMIDVGNDGHGGCDHQYPIKPFIHKDVEKVNKWCCDNLPKWSDKDVGIKNGNGKKYDTDLEMWCGDQVNKFLVKRDEKRQSKGHEKRLKKLLDSKILYRKNKDIFTMTFKNGSKITQKHLLYFANVYSPQKGYDKIADFKVLNTIPFDKALEIYTKSIS